MGLLQHNDGKGGSAETPDDSSPQIPNHNTIQAGNSSITLDYGTPILAKTLNPIFHKAPASTKAQVTINFQHDTAGYALAMGSKLIATHVSLGEIGYVVSRALFKEAVTNENEIALAGTWVQQSKDKADFFLSPKDNERDSSLPLLYANERNKDISGGATLNLDTGAITPIGLPIQIDDTSIEAAKELKALTSSGIIQNNRRGRRGRLLASTYQGKGEDFALQRLYLEDRQSDTETIIEKATHHDALAALLEAAIAEQGKTLTGSQVQKLNDWLTGIEAHIVKPANLVETVKHLTK